MTYSLQELQANGYGEKVSNEIVADIFEKVKAEGYDEEQWRRNDRVLKITRD